MTSPQTILTADQYAELRRLHIEVRRLVDKGAVGAYRSAFRGHGIEFEELREYSPGDEIRSIDWHVTARAGKPYVKTYREERELSIVLALDISGSTTVGTGSSVREVVIAKTAAALAMIALSNNDRLGVLTFSDAIEYFHPPSKNSADVWRILHTAVDTAQAKSSKTSLHEVFTFLQQTIRRSSAIFVISDFLAPLPERDIGALAKRHDVTAVHVQDPSDTTFPSGNLATIRNPETGEVRTIDLRSHLETEPTNPLHDTFARQGVDVLSLRTDTPFFPLLRSYFLNRAKQSGARYA